MADSPEVQQAMLAALVVAYKATTYGNYIAMAGFAIVVADFLHTFPDEVRLMWPTQLSVPKALFFTLRYFIFMSNSFAALYSIPTNQTPEQCRNAFFRNCIASTLLVVGAEAVLFIRLYAFAGRGKKMLFYLILQFIAVHGTTYPLMVVFLKSAKFAPMPFPNMACMPVEIKSYYLATIFVVLLFGVFMVMAIMVVILVRRHRVSRYKNGLLSVFYRDGLVYFLSLSVLLSVNIFVNFFAPDGYKFMFTQAAIDLHTILSTRMLLHLRAWGERDKARQESHTVQLIPQNTRTLDGMGYVTDLPLSPEETRKRELELEMQRFGMHGSVLGEGTGTVFVNVTTSKHDV